MDFFIGFFGQFAREPVQKKPILWSDRPEGLPPPQLYGPCFVNFFKGHFLSVLEPICYVQARKNNKIAVRPLAIKLSVIPKKNRLINRTACNISKKWYKSSCFLSITDFKFIDIQ